MKRFENEPFAFLGVNSDFDRRALRKKIEAEEIPWRNWWNGPEGPAGPIARAWGVSAWPSTFVIDPDGIVRHRNLRGEALENAVARLLAEARAPRGATTPRN